jgi:hypothetical protein
VNQTSTYRPLTGDVTGSRTLPPTSVAPATGACDAAGAADARALPAVPTWPETETRS